MAHLQEFQAWPRWGVNQGRIRPLESRAIWQPDVLSVNKHNPFWVTASITSTRSMIIYIIKCWCLQLHQCSPWVSGINTGRTLQCRAPTHWQSGAGWSDHPSWGSDSVKCPDCSPSTHTAHSLLASTALSQPQGACLPEDLQLCLRIAKDSFILRNTKWLP